MTSGNSWQQFRMNNQSAFIIVGSAIFAYFFSWLSLKFLIGPSFPSTIWFSNGILLSLLLLYPSKKWWLALLAFFCVNFFASLEAAQDIVYILKFSSFYCIEAALLAYLIKQNTLHENFLSNLRDFFVFTFLTFIVSFFISILETAFLESSPFSKDLWALNVLTNILSYILVTPFIFSWIYFRRDTLADYSKRLEFIVVLLISFLSCLYVFGNENFQKSGIYPLPFFLFPFLVWASLRFTVIGAATVGLLIGIISIISTNEGYGPFVGNSDITTRLIILSLFIIIAIVGSLLLAVIFSEKDNALKERDNFFLLSGDLFAIINFEGKFLRFNPSWNKLLSFSNEEINSNTLFNLVDPQDKAQFVSAFNGLKNVVFFEKFESRLITKDGSSKWFQWDASAIKQKNMIYLVGHDTTKRRELENTLRRNVALLNARNEASPFAITISDANGNCIDCNPYYLKITGYNFEEIAGNGWVKTIHPLDRDRVVGEWFNSIHHGASFKSTYRIVHKSGKILWVVARGAAIQDGDEIIGYVRGIEDITAIKQAQEEANALKEKAEHAVKTKSSFLAVMSHEIRTPMSGVLGMAELLMDTYLNDEQKDYLQTIVISGNHLLKIINDILDFSKIESGKLDFVIGPLDISQCIEDAFDLNYAKASEKNIDISYLIESNVPTQILADMTRLKQILVNLINNAIKFTEIGEISIKVSLNEQNNENIELLFAVSDTGIGIPKDKIKELFQPFSQINHSDQKNIGSGLGLAISSQLVHLMNGKIWVESSEHRGSTFYFTLRTQAFPELPDLQEESFLASIRDKKVLIVNSKEKVLEALSFYCSQWGLKQTILNSPEKALDLLEKEKFDFVILDWRLTGLSGLELAQKIHDSEKNRTLPIILFAPPQAAKEKLGPLIHFISKPIKCSLLFEKIKDLFSSPPKNVEINNNSTEQGDFKPLNILLAEDDVVSQKLSLIIFKKLGYSIDLAVNGFEVLEKISKKKYDVIFMDVQMAGMDGITTTREIIKRYPKENRPKIIAMTANAHVEDKMRCLQAGMDDYVSKPISINILRNLLKTII